EIVLKPSRVRVLASEVPHRNDRIENRLSVLGGEVANRTGEQTVPQRLDAFSLSQLFLVRGAQLGDEIVWSLHPGEQRQLCAAFRDAQLHVEVKLLPQIIHREAVGAWRHLKVGGYAAKRRVGGVEIRVEIDQVVHQNVSLERITGEIVTKDRRTAADRTFARVKPIEKGSQVSAHRAFRI